MTWNLQVLECAVQEYLTAEEEYRLFIKIWKPCNSSRWLKETAQEREEYIKFTERRDAKWDTVVTICKMLDWDVNALVSIVKSINRYSKTSRKVRQVRPFWALNKPSQRKPFRNAGQQL